MRAIEIEVVVGAEQGRDPVRFTGLRQRHPLRPADALLPFDHEAKLHQASEHKRRPPAGANELGQPLAPARNDRASVGEQDVLELELAQRALE